MGSRSSAGTSSEDREEETGENEHDLATVLAYLLRSGQIRLSQAEDTGIEFIHTGSDSDEDFIECNPEVDLNPDTSKIDASELRQEILQHCRNGYCGKTLPWFIPSMLKQREIGCCRNDGRFASSDCSVISSCFLPNKMRVVAAYQHKAFCGSYSQEGNVFLSACQDQRIRLYDTSKGQFRLFKTIHARDVGWSILDTAFSPDGNYIIYSSWSDCIHICNVYGDHDVHNALNLQPGDSRFCAFSIQFSSDNKEILAGANDGCLYIYDRERNERTLRIDSHEDDINAVSFADSGSQILYSGGDDGLCKVWDRRTLQEANPQPVGMFAGHTDGITYIDSKGDSRHLISNSKDQTIKLWDLRKFSGSDCVESCRRAVAQQHWDYRWQQVPRRSKRNTVISNDPSLMTYRGHGVLQTLVRCHFSPEFTTGQKYIYTGCATGSVIIYDVLTGKRISKLLGQTACVRDVSWHPTDNILMSTSWDGTIGRWEYSRKRAKRCKDNDDDDEDDDEDDDDDESDDNDKFVHLRARRRIFVDL
ncbi:DDB1- and CUL4-associated factor 11-like [Ptychodera flava]|uniref:DDB1- and CUL4-associated factor 11-like n=1 Tax=Ptychodera flava TaxID=63121 RepID=UPI00396A6195